MTAATIPEPTDWHRAQAEELRLPLVWTKAWLANKPGEAERWGWAVVTDPADWVGSQILASTPHLERASAMGALALAQSWARQRGVFVGALP